MCCLLPARGRLFGPRAAPLGRRLYSACLSVHVSFGASLLGRGGRPSRRFVDSVFHGVLFARSRDSVCCRRAAVDAAFSRGLLRLSTPRGMGRFLCGIGLLVNIKAAFVVAVCALWLLAELPLLLAGLAAPLAVAGAWFWFSGAWPGFYEQVWRWGLLYSRGWPTAHPFQVGFTRMAAMARLSCRSGSRRIICFSLSRQSAALEAGRLDRILIRRGLPGQPLRSALFSAIAAAAGDYSVARHYAGVAPKPQSSSGRFELVITVAPGAFWFALRYARSG